MPSVFISEFLPNPEGKDTEAEFIELYNSGPETVSLAGWSLKDAAGKTFVLHGDIGPGSYRVFYSKETRIALNNNGEKIFLYNAESVLVDEAGFSGLAESGTSFIRQGGSFVASSPLPGAKNILQEQEDVSSLLASSDILAPGKFPTSHIFAGLFSSLLLAAVFVMIWKTIISNRDEKSPKLPF